MSDQRDHPKMILPPPLIFLGGLVIGGVLAWIYPYSMLPTFIAVPLGIVLTVAGTAVIISIRRQMVRAETNIEPWKPTTTIIDTGLYAYSRNPIYIAMAVIYLGISCLFNSIWFLPILPLCLLTVHFGMVVNEEEYLEAKFGDVYRDYKRRVRRWI